MRYCVYVNGCMFRSAEHFDPLYRVGGNLILNRRISGNLIPATASAVILILKPA